MTKPLGNEDLSDKVGERVIDKPELPPGGIMNENDVHMMKMKVNGANCRVVLRKHLGGSVLNGTVFNRWEGLSTYLKVESGEPTEKLAHLIKNAKAGCFAEGLITQQVPLHRC